MAFIRLGRPKFLLYSTVLFGLGTAAAVHAGERIDLALWARGQLFVWCVHLMTHYCNEYFDLEADRANPSPTAWTGGSRVLVQGLVSPATSLAAAHVLLFVCGALAATMPTPTARGMACATVALAWFYTAPPFRLNYNGLGELTVATVLNGLWPLLAFHLQATRFSPALLCALVPTFVVQLVRMMVMNLSDYEGDRRVQKRTLVVLLGPVLAVRVFAVGQLVAYGAIVAFLSAGVLPAPVGAAMLVTSPIALWQTRRLLRGAIRDPRQANSVVFWASTHVALTFAAAMAGFVLATPPSRWSVLPVAVLVVFASVVALQMRRYASR
jgi:1,4-dihydroxy-2-naphthoate octaprenyltransferase